MNATDRRRTLRSVASRYSHYGRTHSGSSEAVETVKDVRKPQRKAKPTDVAPTKKLTLETRTEPKVMLERLALQRSPEKLLPEGNGGLPSVSPMKVPSTVLQRISQKASRKNAVVVTSTQRAHQLLRRAKNRLQVKKEKVVRQAAKKLSSSSALALSTATALTCPTGETGNGIDPDNTGMPASMEEDEDEIGEASEVEEGGEEEEEQPRKVKIKLPDSKVPSELYVCNSSVNPSASPLLYIQQ